MPAGFEVTVSPLRPVAVTVSVAFSGGGGGGDDDVTVSDREIDTPAWLAVTLTEVDAATAKVVTVKVALVAPVGTVTFGGTLATAVLSLESEMTAPPAGAGAFSVTVP
jgi:hypothetical protein